MHFSLLNCLDRVLSNQADRPYTLEKRLHPLAAAENLRAVICLFIWLQAFEEQKDSLACQYHCRVRSCVCCPGPKVDAHGVRRIWLCRERPFLPASSLSLKKAFFDVYIQQTLQPKECRYAGCNSAAHASLCMLLITAEASAVSHHIYRYNQQACQALLCLLSFCVYLPGMAAKESVPRHVAPMSSLIRTSAGSVPRYSLCPSQSCIAQVLALPVHTLISEMVLPLPSSSSLVSQAPLSWQGNEYQAQSTRQAAHWSRSEKLIGCSRMVSSRFTYLHVIVSAPTHHAVHLC